VSGDAANHYALLEELVTKRTEGPGAPVVGSLRDRPSRADSTKRRRPPAPAPVHHRGIEAGVATEGVCRATELS